MLFKGGICNILAVPTYQTRICKVVIYFSCGQFFHPAQTPPGTEIHSACKRMIRGLPSMAMAPGVSEPLSQQTPEPAVRYLTPKPVVLTVIMASAQHPDYMIVKLQRETPGSFASATGLDAPIEKNASPPSCLRSFTPPLCRTTAPATRYYKSPRFSSWPRELRPNNKPNVVDKMAVITPKLTEAEWLAWKTDCETTVNTLTAKVAGVRGLGGRLPVIQTSDYRAAPPKTRCQAAPSGPSTT